MPTLHYGVVWFVQKVDEFRLTVLKSELIRESMRELGAQVHFVILEETLNSKTRAAAVTVGGQWGLCRTITWINGPLSYPCDTFTALWIQKFQI